MAKTIFNMPDGILTPCNAARSRHWFRQVTAPCSAVWYAALKSWQWIHQVERHIFFSFLKCSLGFDKQRLLYRFGLFIYVLCKRRKGEGEGRGEREGEREGRHVMMWRDVAPKTPDQTPPMGRAYLWKHCLTTTKVRMHADASWVRTWCDRVKAIISSYPDN